MCCGTNLHKELLVLGRGVKELSGVNNQIKPGCCAHGLPAGACPVCSMSGGGSKRSDRSGKIGEMSYHECVMAWNMIKARALAQKNHKAYLKQLSVDIKLFETTMDKLVQKMKAFSQVLSRTFVLKPVAVILNITAIPLLSVIKNIPKLVQAFNNLRFEITDKLTAIFGEAKAFLQKKAEEGLKIMSSFFEKIFKASKKNNAEDDDTKIDDDKKIFNLKTIIHKIKEKYKNRKDKKDEHGTEN